MKQFIVDEAPAGGIERVQRGDPAAAGGAWWRGRRPSSSAAPAGSAQGRSRGRQ
jgi:hypothetical protein